MFVMGKMTTCTDCISIKYVTSVIEKFIKWAFWFSPYCNLHKTLHKVDQKFALTGNIREDLNSLFVFVVCESSSGLNLPSTQFFLPLHGWHFLLIFSLVVVLTLFQLFLSIISLRFLSGLWSHDLVVKAVDSKSRGPGLKTTGWLQGQLSLSSFQDKSTECQELLGTE